MEEQLFNINKAMAVADLVIKFHQALNKLIIYYDGNNALLEPMLNQLKSAYDGQLSLIANANYESIGGGGSNP